MAPQDDLTAERAVAIRLYENIFAMSPDTEAMEAGDDCQYEAIARALKTARQEALREAARVCREWHKIDRTNINSVAEMAEVLADKLDRLASEGG